MLTRAAKTEWQRRKRAEAAIAAGREPHRTGRPATGRTRKHHGDRAGQRIRARARLLRSRGDNGTTETRHPIMDAAIEVASRYCRRDRGSVMYVPLWEDAVCVAALAICRGEDPETQVRDFVREERGWGKRTCSMEGVA